MQLLLVDAPSLTKNKGERTVFLRLGRVHFGRDRRAAPRMSSAVEAGEVGHAPGQEGMNEPAGDVRHGQCDGSGDRRAQAVLKGPSAVHADTADRPRMSYTVSARGADRPLLNYYAVLGVPRDATAEHLERAYRRYVTVIHPDKCFGDPERHAVAQEKLKAINAAMQVLRDPAQRARYDAALARFPLTARLAPSPFEHP